MIISVSTNDLGNTGSGGALQDVDNVQITVGNPNAPVVNLDLDDSAGAGGNDFATSWTQGGGGVYIVDSDAVVTDANDTTLESLTITLTNMLDVGDEGWIWDATGTSITGGIVGNVLTLSGTDSVANYQQVLRTLQYDNIAASPDMTTRIFTFVANDGTSDGPAATTTLTMTAPNTAPLNTIPGAQVTPQDTDLVFSVGDGNALSVSDPDAGANPLEVTLAVTNGTLTLNPSVAEGSEALINTTTTGVQYRPSIAVANDGSYVVVWSSNGQDGDTWGVYAQRFDANGTKIGGEVQVNQTTADSQSWAEVAIDPASGEYVVVWRSMGQDSGATQGVYMRRFDANSVAQSAETLVNTTVAGDQAEPDIAMDAAGGFVIVWSGQGSGDSDGIFMQRYDQLGNPLGGETLVNSFTTGDQLQARIAMDDAGNYVVIWRSAGQDGTTYGVYGQRFNAAGVAQGSEFRVNPLGEDRGSAAAVAMTATGEFVVSWRDVDTEFIRAQRYDAAGVAQGGALTVSQATADSVINTDVAINTAGDFVVSWDEYELLALDFTGVFAQRFDASGNLVGPQFEVNTTTNGLQNSPSMSLEDNGRLRIVWGGGGPGDGSGIFLQQYRTADVTFSVGDGVDDATITFQANQNDINAVLDGLVYSPTPAFTGADTLTITANDLGNTGSGGPLQDVDNVQITVTAVAAAPPSLDLDQDDSAASGLDYTAAWNEGSGPVAIADADAVLSDADSANLQSLTVTITNLLDGAAELLAADTSGTVITASYVAATGVLTLSGSDTVANYQQVLRTVTYDNATAAPATTNRTISFVASDGVNSSIAATTTLSITPVDDTPVLDLDADDSTDVGDDFVTSFTENGGPVAATDVDAVLSDVDSPNLVSLTATITNLQNGTDEVLAADTTGTGISASYDSATGVLTLSGSDTVANYQTVLRTVTYDNLSDTPGTTRYIDFEANDGSGPSNVAVTSMDINALDDVPQLDLDADDSVAVGVDFAAAWNEGAGPVAIADVDASVADVDSANLTSLIVTITNLLDGAAEVLAADTTGTSIVASYDSVTGILTLAGADTAANYQQVLRTVTYDSSSQAPDDTDRTITVVANDGTSPSLTATTTVSIITENDVNVLTLTAGTVTYNEQSVPLAIDPGLTLVDPDGAQGENPSALFTAVVRITANYTVDDVLGFTDTANIVGSVIGNQIVLSVRGGQTASVADFEAALRTVTFYNGSDAPSGLDRTILFAFDDGIDSGPAVNKILEFVVEDDAPIVDLDADDSAAAGGDFAATWSEGGGAVGIVDTDATIADVDSTNLTSLIVTITNAMDGTFEVLSADTTGTSIAASYDSATHVLSLTGSDTLANYQQVLRTVTYDNGAGNPNSADRSITFVANDAGGGSLVSTTTLSMAAGLSQGLVGHYQFDEGAGTVAVDSSPFAWDGSHAGPTNPVHVEGHVGTGALDFAGDFDIVEVPDAPDGHLDFGAGNFTVSFWLNTTQVPGSTTRLIGKQANGATPGFVFFTDSFGDVNFSVGDGSQNAIVWGGGALDGDWHRVTGIRSGNSFELYIDGVLADSTTRPVGSIDNATNLVMGASSAEYDGLLDDVRLYDEALSLTDIQSLANPPQVDLDADDSSAPGNAYVSSWTEDAGPVAIADLDAALTDGNDANLQSMTVTIANRLDGALEVLAADTTGTSIVANYNPGTGVLSLTGSDTLANYQQVLRTVTYDNSSDTPNTTARTIEVAAHDGMTGSNTAIATLSIFANNDDPTANPDADTVVEGAVVTIDLAANDTDPDNAIDPTSIQIVSAPSNGSIFINGDGTVDYTHDGSETLGDSFTYTIRDASGAISNAATVTITVTPQDDQPVFGNNALTISEGGSVVFSASELSATDAETLDSSLQFTVSGVTGGQFELVASPGVAITTFTQGQVTSGAVRFVHDGGEAAPAYSVSVFDGALTTGPIAATITFTPLDDPPVIVNNALTITEGQTVVLSASELSATDAETLDASLQFTVSGVTGGQFELVAAPGAAITTFTQAQITGGAVQFVHDGGEAAPSYSVSVFDGALTTGPAAATVTFTNLDDAPVLTANALTLSEGQTVVIAGGDLSATDAETLDSALQFTVSGVTGGQFELVAAPGAAITTFTQAQVTSGAVQFVHDGGEAAPSYSVSVFDGGLTTGPAAAVVTFTNVNDAPAFGNNSLTISEGQTVVLGAGDLSATDVDDLDPALQFTVSGVTGGQFELVAAPGAALTTFTQAQITSGAVQFVHDGNEAAPSYSVSVFDGALTTGPVAATVTFTNQNDSAVIVNNSLTLSEGQTVVLGPADLLATDAETLDSALQFTISGVTGGQFELVAAPGAAITTFSQAQVTSGAIQFVHGGGEAAPTYSVSVFDGTATTGPAAAAVTFTNLDDAPVIVTNSLTLSEGQTVVLNAGDLTATDAETLDSALQFTVSGVSGGQFELVAAPGAAITNFTQGQVTSGAVQFVHDGGESAPSYSVSVFDGALTTGPAAAAITFTNTNDAPVLGNNGLTISEGQTVVLGSGDVSATDIETLDAALQFTVSGVTGGQFELVASPGAAITSFTQTQVTSGSIQFAHDGGEVAPSYSVSVFDGTTSTGPAAATITFTNTNDAPVIANNSLTLSEGQTVVLGAGDLAATDVETLDSALQFTVSSVTGGQFELVAAPGAAITSFTQAQVTSGAIQFVHDSGEAAPTYSVSVFDGATTTGPAAAAITFSGTNDAPVIGNNSLTIAEGQTVVLGTGDLSATDAETLDSALQFTVSGVTGGQFELVAAPGTAITNFTQAQVSGGAIQFVHDGGEAAPSYGVSVFDGAVTTGPAAAAITFTNLDDAPAFTNNGLTLSEGQTIVLGPGDLAATDAETLDSALQFTVSGVTGGQFELVAAPGAALTNFTQAQITSGAVQFVHDGGEAPPAYSVSVFDGALTTGPVAAAITFTNTNDAPVIGANSLTISEGQTVVLGAGDLSATDAEALDSTLQFTASGVTGGQFELVAAPGAATTSFTQAQVTSGAIQFVHDGNESAPTYSISVFDGATTTGPAAAAITFTNTNDAPVIGNNSLTIAEGQTVVLGAGDLAATDVETPDSALQFTVSGVTGGQFELVASPGSAITTFTQGQLTSGAVQFVHDGGEAAPTYSISAFDGTATTGPAAAAVTFTGTNDAPVIGNNGLTLSEGQTVVIGSGDLSATDVDDLDSALQFTASGVAGGQFELVASPGAAITTFTQAQIASGAIQFVHDGGESAPSYSVSVFDGTVTTGPVAATITFTNLNDPPVFTANALTIAEGQTVVLGAADLAASDVETLDSMLQFTVSGVTGGQFELTSNPTVAITSFSQAQLTAGLVRFVHDGGEAPPSYSVTVFDGGLSTGPQAAAITFTNTNDAPIVGNNSLTVSEGQTVVLGAGDLSATDAETADPSLQFSITGLSGGQFELVASPGAAITSFTQAQVTSGAVQFAHDGGEAAPTYSVSVFDGTTTTGPAAATITFTNQNDAPVIGSNSLTISEGETVVIGSGDLSATDVETADSALQFTVSAVTGGQFELVASPGAAITTFTQAQVTSGAVQFVHDGNEAAPSYSVSVFDGTATTGPAAATVTFTNQNDAPVIGSNSLTISEGQTVVLGASDLSASDVETLDSALQFTVSGVTGGQFELVASPGAAVTMFTQAQITSGAVQFVHDGNEAAPTYSVSVFDGTATTGPAAAAITFTNQNDAPVFGNNSLTISEAETVVLGVGDLSATDVETLDSALQFTVSSVIGGQFELVASPGAAVTTFTQAQVTSGAIQFVHDGNEAAPSYSVSVFDGTATTGPAAATITFTNVNDAPTATPDGDTLAEGATITIDLALNDSDPDDGIDLGSIVIESPPARGSILVNGDGTVDYTHDGSETLTDSFTYSIKDLAGAKSNTVTVNLVITPVDDAPIITSNGLTLIEGGAVILTGVELAATDAETPDSALQFSVSGVTGGQFEFVASPGNAITTFSQAQVTGGAVRFVHDGGEAAPTYDVSVFDGAITTGPAAAGITFSNVNDPPVLGNNTLTLSEGQTVVLTGADLSATDVDDLDPALQFTVSAVSGGRFELMASPGTAITSFTQAQVTSGAVQFVHDGGETAPTYDVSVFDGALATTPSAAAIAFTNVNDAPALDLDADDSSGASGTGFTATWIEGLGPVAVADLDAALIDSDSPTLQALTVTITNLRDGANEALTADTTGTSISAAYNPLTGTLVLSGADSTLAYQQVLRTIRYDNASVDPDPTTRSLSFVADDGLLLSPVATTSLGVTPVNDAPVAAAESYSPTEDMPFAASAAAGVLANDSDPDSAIHAVLVSGPSNAASFTLNADGSFSYLPRADFFGTDSFSYVASDGALDSSVTVVTLTTLPVNDAPRMVANLGMDVLLGSLAPLSSSQLLAGDVDDSASDLVYRIATTPSWGHIALQSSPSTAITRFTQADIDAGRVIFAQHGGSEAADAFTFTVEDAAGASIGPIAFTVQITTVPEPPVDPVDPVDPVLPDPILDPEPETAAPELREDPRAEDPAGVEIPPLPIVTTETTIRLSGIVELIDTDTEIPEFPEQERDRDAQQQSELSEASRIANLLRGYDAPLERILDELRAGLEAEAGTHLEAYHGWVLRSESIILALSTSLVAVLLRSSALWAVALSSLPMWRRLDPVAVLGLTGAGRRNRADEVRFAEMLEDETTRVGKLLDEEDDEEAGS